MHEQCTDVRKANRKAKAAWLSRYRVALKREGGIADKLAEARSKAEHLGTPLQAAPSHDGPDTSQLQRGVERVIALEEALEDTILLCLRYRDEIAAAIDEVDDPNLQEVLKRRYLLGQNYSKISESMRLGERRISQLWKRALDQVPIEQEAGR